MKTTRTEYRYNHHVDQIRERAWHVAGLFNADYDELFAQGTLVFMRCAQRFDPNMGIRFNSYLYTALDRNLKRHAAKYPCRTFDPETAPNPVEVRPSMLPASSQWVEQFMENISNEAATVVRLLLNCPEEAFGLLADDGKRVAKRKIREGLLRKGYTAQAVRRVFAELKGALT